jgi:hypothetical protein
VLAAEETPWAFVVLPKAVSDTLPRRGRTSIVGSINGVSFQATLEPDGQLSQWHSSITIARLNWIYWVTLAKQTKSRIKRISDACAMLSDGKARVCCFDSSGFYSQAFSVPKTLR